MNAEPDKPANHQDYKAVFEVAIDDPEIWDDAFQNVENVLKSLGTKTTKIEVVALGKGIDMLLVTTAAANPEIKATIEKLHDNGVVFSACENTMRIMRITRNQLLPLATTVHSGVSEVIRKQETGYACIKIGG